MLIHRMILVLALACVATAADKPRWQTVELQDVEFDFRLVQDVGEIERLLGDRLDGDFTLVEVRLRALYGTTVELDRDSFTLRSFSGNDRSGAQSPDRIAGGGSLLVRPGTVGAPGVYRATRERIPVGPNPEGGPPRQIGGAPPGVGGSLPTAGSSKPSQRSIGVPAADTELDESLHGRLQRLELPLDAGDRDVNGYLYFQIDPKNKRKHISLSYDGRYGEFRLSFEN